MSFAIGDTVLVGYNRGAYLATVMDTKTEKGESFYLIHWFGWKKRYDEFVQTSRIHRKVDLESYKREQAQLKLDEEGRALPLRNAGDIKMEKIANLLRKRAQVKRNPGRPRSMSQSRPLKRVKRSAPKKRENIRVNAYAREEQIAGHTPAEVVQRVQQAMAHVDAFVELNDTLNMSLQPAARLGNCTNLNTVSKSAAKLSQAKLLKPITQEPILWQQISEAREELRVLREEDFRNDESLREEERYLSQTWRDLQVKAEKVRALEMAHDELRAIQDDKNALQREVAKRASEGRRRLARQRARCEAMALELQNRCEKIGARIHDDDNE